MSDDQSTKETKHNDRFEIGGENLLPENRSGDDAGEGQFKETDRKYQEALEDIRIRVGTLLKMETVSLLLGAGASVDCGGPLIGSVPLEIEKVVNNQCSTQTSDDNILPWLRLFYRAVRACSTEDTPVQDKEIKERRDELQKGNPATLPANLEQVLAQLYRWRSALPEAGGRLQIEGSPKVDATAKDLDAALQHATRALASACDLPVAGNEGGHAAYKTLIRKLLTRPLNLKRVNVFTLNYDTLVEQAADAEGVVLLDGFVGTVRRVFRPESYEQDLYFPAETTEGRVHRFDRVLHLYKLHGSITWRATEPTVDNPYGVLWAPFDPKRSEPLLIYPTPAKYGEALGLPYSELFRRFAAAVVRPQSVLFVIGYGFGDEHVNAIIRQALAVPSFTLVIVDPAPKSAFVQTLRAQKDRRVWVAEGHDFGTFKGFVEKILPDLREEEIRKKVLATYRALTKDVTPKGDSPNDD